MNDPYNLERFIVAQEPIFSQVRSELSSGKKCGHWMWFVFPQIKGLGKSDTAKKYAISSSGEARAYLKHPILGPRLRHCTQLVTQIHGHSADEIFGYPDNLKFRSSMTLFANVAKDNQIFADALKRFFSGEPDTATIEELKSPSFS